jgi:hypothetical protein
LIFGDTEDITECKNLRAILTARALERVSSLPYGAHLTIKGSRKGEDEIDAAVEMLIEIIMGNFAVHKKLKAKYLDL